MFETSDSFSKRHFRNLGAFSENVFEFSDVASYWVASQDGIDFKWWHAFRTCLICNDTSCEKFVTKLKSRSKCGEFLAKKFQISSIFKGKRKNYDKIISNFHFSHFGEISHQKNVAKSAILKKLIQQWLQLNSLVSSYKNTIYMDVAYIIDTTPFPHRKVLLHGKGYFKGRYFIPINIHSSRKIWWINLALM